jgi:hypothetical protein
MGACPLPQQSLLTGRGRLGSTWLHKVVVPLRARARVCVCVAESPGEVSFLVSVLSPTVTGFYTVSIVP